MSSLRTSWLLLIFLPLVNFGPIPGGKVTFAHLISLVLLVIWAARDSLRLRHPSFLWALAFLLLVASNVLIGTVSRSDLGQITQLVNYAFMMGIMLVGFNLAARDDITPEIILDNYFRIGVFYAAVSLLLYGYGIFNEAFIYAVTDFFNIANTFDRGGLSAELGESVLPRITGLSPEPSFWSIYMSSVVAVGVSRKRGLLQWRMLIVELALGLTLARTGMVAVGMLLLYMLVRRSPLLFGWVIGLALAAALAFVDIDLSGADISVTQRFGSLTDGWNAFLQSPFVGLGWGGFRQYSLEQRLDYPVIFNYYLQVAVEGGIVGIFLLAVFLTSIVRHTPKAYRVVLLVIFVAWFSAAAYNLAYIWFLFGVFLAAGRREKAAAPAVPAIALETA